MTGTGLYHMLVSGDSFLLALFLSVSERKTETINTQEGHDVGTAPTALERAQVSASLPAI